MGPTHLASDDLVAVRIVDVLLEQLHVPLRLAVLLLSKAFPVVLVPGPLWLIEEISHTRLLSHLGNRCKGFITHRLQPELTASRINIVPFFPSDGGIDAAAAQSLKKSVL